MEKPCLMSGDAVCRIEEGKAGINSFSPLVAEDPKLLILGSMPGRESLRKGEYYAHKQNRFFKIIFKYHFERRGESFGEEHSRDYALRKKIIADNRMALFDVYKYCERENSSLDSKIKKPELNDILSFVKGVPSIDAVLVNGTKAAEGFEKAVQGALKSGILEIDGRRTVKYHILPSTSPANARMDLESLYEKWKEKIDLYLN